MTLNTTKLGIAVFDQALGGIYLHKPTILCCRRKSGKFVVATQLMVKTLLAGERMVLFTAKNPEEVIRSVPSDVIDIGEAVENGQLLICSYNAMEREGTGPYAPLPFPQALNELTALVNDNGVSYAIFDSVVPWTAINPLEAMQEHVDTFFSTLEGLGLTSLLLLPEPASAAALSLSTTLREFCPINIEIISKNFGAEFTLQVTKFQGLKGGAKILPREFPLDLKPGVGFESPDAPKGKTMDDLATLEAFSRTAAANKQKSAPAFRPFFVGGPTDFSGSASMPLPAATPGKADSAFTPFVAPQGPAPAAPVPAAPAAPPPPTFSPFLAPAAPTPVASPAAASAPAESEESTAAPSSGAKDGFSFASVIDLPEFPHQEQGTNKAPTPPAAPPAKPQTSGIKFSSVIS